MLLVNKTKRINVIATQSYEDQDLSAVAPGNGMPEGMVKIIPSINEITIENFKRICSHPDFIKSFSKGNFFLVGKDSIIDKLAMEKKKVSVKQLKKTRATGEIKGFVYSEGPAKLMEIKAITAAFDKSLATFPKKLSEIKDLLAYEEQDAMKISEFTMDLGTLNRWLKAEKKYKKDNEDETKDTRDGVIEMIEGISAKVKAFDQRVAKARGEEETDDEE